MCILRDLPPHPPSRRTLGHYVEGAPPILYVLTVSWRFPFLENGKKSEEIKRELFK